MPKVPKGKVILYAYIKEDNKLYLEEQAKTVGTNVSVLLDLLLTTLRWKKQNIKVMLERKSH